MDILFLFVAFGAGLLTVLAPCILPLLPVIVGGSVSGGTSKARAFTVVASLGASVLLFTLLLKASTAFIMVPPEFWQYLSGGLLIAFGVVTAFPGLWESLPFTNLLNRSANKAVSAGYQKKSFWGDVLVGVALGPVFTSCSPTYFIVLATILPADPVAGIVYLVAYTIGLSLALLAIALIGQAVADKLGAASDPHGRFKRAIGILFVLVGLAIVTGLDKQLATSLPSGFYGITAVEQRILEAADGRGSDMGSTTPGTARTAAEKAARYEKAPELSGIAAYLNTGGEAVSLAQYAGKKVVLVDFWTYSCINCQRTTPYLNAWYDKYEDDGLVIIGVHTPEFAFEKVAANVQKAIGDEGIRYPVVLDNDYSTWNGFANKYWPHKYLVDIDGYVVYDQIGEGEYAETEAAIQAALRERAERLGGDVDGGTVAAPEADVEAGSPETYFGWWRNEYLKTGTPREAGRQTGARPTDPVLNGLYLVGTWDLAVQYATPVSDASVIYHYVAKDVYLVASSPTPLKVQVLQDGQPVGAAAGEDVKDGYLEIEESRLYKVIHNPAGEEHTLELRIEGSGGEIYTFTFG